MWRCYLLSLLPLIGGLIFWIKSRRITLWEWLVAVIGGLLLTGIIHLCIVHGMTSDTETWSGQLTSATFYPEYVEEYEVAIYRTEYHTVTDSDGNSHEESEEVFDHYETRYRTHPEEWDAKDSLRFFEFGISKDQFRDIAAHFGGFSTNDGHKSGFYSGDPNIYVAENKTGYIYPTTDTRTFVNKVKAAPSVFSFAAVPTNIPVLDYPHNTDGWSLSDRLKGTAKDAMPILEWDRMNSRLGPRKKVNVIACGFPKGTDSKVGNWQESKYFGGRKNDLVICYAGDSNKPEWVKVFGWTEKFECKHGLEFIILDKGFSFQTLPLIEAEIRKSYKIKNWEQFDYLSVEPPPWAYTMILIVMLVFQAGWWTYSMVNKIDKDGVYSDRRYL
jgi:hypothetical protein